MYVFITEQLNGITKGVSVWIVFDFLFFPVSLVAFQENIKTTTTTTAPLKRRRKSRKSQIIVLLNARFLMQLLNVALVLAKQSRKKTHTLAGYTHSLTRSLTHYLLVSFVLCPTNNILFSSISIIFSYFS